MIDFLEISTSLQRLTIGNDIVVTLCTALCGQSFRDAWTSIGDSVDGYSSDGKLLRRLEHGDGSIAMGHCAGFSRLRTTQPLSPQF